MAAFIRFNGVVATPRGSRHSGRCAAIAFAALAAYGWDAAAQIAVFLWMALVVALFAVVAAGFFLA